MATDLMIGIGAEYKGRPAFAKASKEVSGLDKAVGKLGKQIASVFAAQKIYQFGKQSLNAFTQDNAAAAQLGKTITNLGLAYDAVGVEKFISQLQSATGVLDDQLRPAFQSLLISTRDYAKSQELLGLALDISAGTGKDLEAVSSALGKAYLGNYASLSKLGGGISKADVASGNFLEIQKKLTATFKGDAQAAVKTYAGQMRLLQVASANAKETIGEGLVLALSKISKGNVTNVTSAMEGLATETENVIVGLGVIISKLETVGKKLGLSAPKSGVEKFLLTGVLSLVGELGKKEIARTKTQSQGYFITKNTGKVIKDTVTNASKLTAEEKKQLELKKAKSILDTSSKVLDIDLIQNVAALQGRITEDETKRLQLQQAILTDNASAAGKLAQELAASQIAAMKAGATDPFASWTDGAKSALAALQAVRTGLAGLGVPSVAIPSTIATPALPAVTVPPSLSNTPMGGYNGPGGVGAQGGSFYVGGQKITIDLNLNGDLGQLVTASTVNNSANGNQNQLSRNFNFSSVS